MSSFIASRRRFLGGAAGVATLSLLPAGASGSALVEITAASAVETLYYLPLYVAKAKGFFEEEGLDVTIFNAQQRTVAVRAVASGDAFSYNGDPAEPALARQRGVGIKNIGVLVDRAAQVVLGRPGVPKNPKEWGGRSIIIPRPPHTAVSLIQMTLIDNGFEKVDADGLVWKGESVRLLPVCRLGAQRAARRAGRSGRGAGAEHVKRSGGRHGSPDQLRRARRGDRRET